MNQRLTIDPVRLLGISREKARRKHIEASHAKTLRTRECLLCEGIFVGPVSTCTCIQKH